MYLSLPHYDCRYKKAFVSRFGTKIGENMSLEFSPPAIKGGKKKDK